MNISKQNRTLVMQAGRVRSPRTRAPFELSRLKHRMSAAPPRQVPSEEPPTLPEEMPVDPPELPEPSSPEVPDAPPDGAPDMTPTEMPPEEEYGFHSPG